MAKAKTASKNNPTTRERAKEYFHNNRKIRPTKLITAQSSFIAAEYEDNGDLVLGIDNTPLPWNMAKIIV